ncbi:MAG: SDR family NAD(P)-dependent oxidoreductase [Pseudomonadota bacterium]
MTGRLEGKTAIVTGGSSGIGLSVAKSYAAEGANVVLLAHGGDKLDQAAAEVPRAVAVSGDVRSFEDNAAAVTEAETRFGGLDIFVANAGVWDWNSRLVDMAPEVIERSFDELLKINVLGYILGAKAAAKALARRRGSLILTLSTASLNSAGGGVLYTASKHACLGLVRQLAYELAPHVRVNGVAIGAALTELRGAEALGLSEKSIKELPLKEGAPMFLPMGELPDPDDFAAPYVMLASAQENRTMTGSVVDALCGYDIRGAMGPNGWSDFDPNKE